MEEILRRLQESNQKAVKLERLLGRMRETCTNLETELTQLQADLADKEQTIADLTEKYDAAKVARSLHNGEDNEMVRSKIDLYLKEIDICLKSLGE
ncbi:MAG: hypothetical protein AAF206_15405 [Bacteroidota bacterium]